MFGLPKFTPSVHKNWISRTSTTQLLNPLLSSHRQWLLSFTVKSYTYLALNSHQFSSLFLPDLLRDGKVPQRRTLPAIPEVRQWRSLQRHSIPFLWWKLQNGVRGHWHRWLGRAPESGRSLGSTPQDPLSLKLVAGTGHTVQTMTPPSSPESSSSSVSGIVRVAGPNGTTRGAIVRVTARGGASVPRFISLTPVQTSAVGAAKKSKKSKVTEEEDNKKRTHKCNFPNCQKVYTKSSHLKAHQRTHTGTYNVWRMTYTYNVCMTCVWRTTIRGTLLRNRILRFWSFGSFERGNSYRFALFWIDFLRPLRLYVLPGEKVVQCRCPDDYRHTFTPSNI